MSLKAAAQALGQALGQVGGWFFMNKGGSFAAMIQRLALLWMLLGGSVFAAEFTQADREWWAFRPVRQVVVPAAGAGWALNGIDRFIARKLAAHGLPPAAAADRRTLIRRVSFDLTGLPPTRAQIAAFLRDDSPGAYGRLVDRLLESPRYGERQATLWLDLVRYADSDGYKSDHYRPEAWRYRDYVIRSFNTDKPYDRFVREQLAGDEIDPGNRDALIATMFLRHWIYEYNQRDVETQWREILADVTNVTGDVLLGLGLQCARCHDHKYDPIPQRDYYRMQAFFAPLLPRDSMPVGTVAQRTRFFERHQAWATATAELRRQLHAIEQPALLGRATGEGFDKFIDRIKTMIRKRPEDRTAYERQIAELSERQFGVEPAKLPERLTGATKAEWERLRAELKAFSAQMPEPLPQVKFVVSDAGPVAPATRLPKKGDAVEPGFLSLLDPGPARITPPPAALRSTGRRTALARWITDPDNPLTSRVMVNRLWQQHFGRGLAANASDFGKLGEPPTHPELLDWLAGRFVADGWSLKKMHRLMVTSAAYRQASANGLSEQADPANTWLARAPIRRLAAEQVRDGLLAVSGELDLESGGEGVASAGSNRRSVYRRMMRNSPDEVMQTFDSPDHISHMPQRNVTTTATQSLLLLNSEWTRQRATALAKRLAKRHPGDAAAQVAAAHELAFGQAPLSSQLNDALAFLDACGAAGEPPALAALAEYCHVLMNANAFLYVD